MKHGTLQPTIPTLEALVAHASGSAVRSACERNPPLGTGLFGGCDKLSRARPVPIDLPNSPVPNGGPQERPRAQRGSRPGLRGFLA